MADLFADGLFAEGLFAEGLFEADGSTPPPTPTPEAPANAGGTIVAGSFSRRKWRSLQDAKRAQSEAEDQAKRLKAKGRKALQEATGKSQEAIAAADRAQADAEINRAVERMTTALEAAQNATALTEILHEANLIEIRAQAVMQAIQEQKAEAAREAEMKALLAKMAQDEQDEEEAVVTLLLM